MARSQPGLTECGVPPLGREGLVVWPLGPRTPVLSHTEAFLWGEHPLPRLPSQLPSLDFCRAPV